METILTIAGSDCSGGAGIQADMKTITAHGKYAMSAITALTAQNTTGIYDLMEVSSEFLEQQLDCIFTDIFPDSVKIGMVGNLALIKVIVKKLKQYDAKNIVLDPVMNATSGSVFLSEEAYACLEKELLPICDVVTPNLLEAERMSGVSILSEATMERAAKIISKKTKGAVLVKGGHLPGDATDLLYEQGRVYWYAGKRIENPNSHGTGCTLSSALACNLAEGYSLAESVQRAKHYLMGTLGSNLNLGKGIGPVNHTALKGKNNSHK